MKQDSSLSSKNRPNSSSRRDFIRRSSLTGIGLTAASVGFPTVIPGSALGKDGATAPSNRVNVGLIGLGLMMKGHQRTMLGKTDVQVLAVCDVDKAKREAGKKLTEDTYAKQTGRDSYSGCDAYNEYERIIERDDIDAIMIVTPDHWHAPISLAAMRAGQDVYCQKPMTLTVNEGRLMSDAAKRHGAILQVGSQQRSNWAFRRASEIVRNGYIGNVHTIYARLGSFGAPQQFSEQPIPEGFDYDRWLGPTPWFPYNEDRVKGNYGGGWRCFWEYGSRKNGDWGAHHFDIIQWALGMDDTGPNEFIPKGFEGTEYQTHIYKDANGAGKDITVLRDHPTLNGQMIQFIGDEGHVCVSRGNRIECSTPEFITMPLADKDVRLYDSPEHHTNWLESIKTRRAPICHAEIGHRTSTICHLSGIAERLGRPLTWDPKTETILGDEAASRQLDRPRRAPYVFS